MSSGLWYDEIFILFCVQLIFYFIFNCVSSLCHVFNNVSTCIMNKTVIKIIVQYAVILIHP